MAKDPAVLFYTSDFLSGVSFMSYEDRGKYITLLCQQHQKGSIPENHMISICGSHDSVVMAQFKRDPDGSYYNKRMRLEAEKRLNYCQSRANNKSGRPKNKIIRKSYDNHMSLHMENENENENNVFKLEKTAQFKQPTVEEVRSYCLERKNVIDAQKWHDFYSAKGFMIGKNKMKDWKAAVRTWEQPKSTERKRSDIEYERTQKMLKEMENQ